MGKHELINAFEIGTVVREDAIEILRQQFESIKMEVDRKGKQQTQGTRRQLSRVWQKSMTQVCTALGCRLAFSIMGLPPPPQLSLSKPLQMFSLAIASNPYNSYPGRFEGVRISLAILRVQLSLISVPKFLRCRNISTTNCRSIVNILVKIRRGLYNVDGSGLAPSLPRSRA